MVLIRRVRTEARIPTATVIISSMSVKPLPPACSLLCGCDPKDTRHGDQQCAATGGSNCADEQCLRGVVRVKSVTTRAVIDAAAL